MIASPPLPESGAFDFGTVETVAETASFRVVRITVDPGGVVPWHWHSRVADRFVGLDGAVEIETRAPRERIVLRPGDRATVPAQTAHRVSNRGDRPARFLTVQAGGAYDVHMIGDAGAGPA